MVNKCVHKYEINLDLIGDGSTIAINYLRLIKKFASKNRINYNGEKKFQIIFESFSRPLFMHYNAKYYNVNVHTGGGLIKTTYKSFYGMSLYGTKKRVLKQNYRKFHVFVNDVNLILVLIERYFGWMKIVKANRVFFCKATIIVERIE